LAQLALIHFIENFVHLFQDDVNLFSVFTDLGHPRQLFRAHLWTRNYFVFVVIFNVVQIFLKLNSLFRLLRFNHLLMLSLLYALLVALHDNCYEHVLNCSVKQNHEDYEVYLPGQTLSPGLQKRVIDYISI
jgi:hypothetical protein